MDELTVRGLGEDLGCVASSRSSVENLFEPSRAEGAAAERRVDRRNESADGVGSSLDHLIGSWTTEEADEFDAALEAFEHVNGIVWIPNAAN